MKKNLIKNLIVATSFAALSSCGGQGSNNPSPVGNLALGKLYRVNSCTEVENYLKDYAAVRSNAMEQDFDSGIASPVPEGEAINSPNEPTVDDPQVTQSDIAFSDPSRDLLYVTKRTENGGLLKIFEAKLENSQELSSIELDFQPRELVTLYEPETDSNLLVLFGENISTEQGITVIYQVNEPSEPQALFRYRYRGQFQEARSIQGNNQAALVWSAGDYFGSEKPPTSEILFPSSFTTDSEGQTNEETLSDCSNHLVYQNEEDTRSYSWMKRSQLFYLSLNNLNFSVSSETIISPAGGNFIHVNPDHVFLIEKNNGSSEVYQFDLPETREKFDLSAYAQVPGSIKDQFFLDEHEGTINIFHQVWPSNESTCVDVCEGPVINKSSDLETGTYFSSYQQSGNQFINTGRIGPFAPDEITYSARFVGPWGYVITFRQIDPLFVVDRRDPSNPKLLDEFKIEEVSYHLQPVPSLNDNQLLLGIGGLPNQGSIVANLFSIDTEGKVSLADQVTIDDEHAYSLGFQDYRALTYDTAGLQFALPYTDYNGETTHLAVFSVDPETQKFGELKKLNKPYVYNANGGSEILRAFFFEGVLTPLSEIEVWIHDLSNLEEITQFNL